MSSTTTATAQMLGLEFSLPDTASVAQSAIQGALNLCARRMGGQAPETVTAGLREGDYTIWGYFGYGLAAHVSEHIGALDNEVRAIYLFDDEATPEDVVFATVKPSLIHLIIHTRRRTSALSSLVAALDRAVAQACAGLIDNRELAHLLDAQIVDDADVEARSGYAALLDALHHRPLAIWRR